MKIRLHGTAEECRQVAERLAPPDGTPACTCDDPDCPDPVHQSPGGAA